jgi:hypothetical protein
VLALYSSGLKRPQIAERLGVPVRDVNEQFRPPRAPSRAVCSMPFPAPLKMKTSVSRSATKAPVYVSAGAS